MASSITPPHPHPSTQWPTLPFPQKLIITIIISLRSLTGLQETPFNIKSDAGWFIDHNKSLINELSPHVPRDSPNDSFPGPIYRRGFANKEIAEGTWMGVKTFRHHVKKYFGALLKGHGVYLVKKICCSTIIRHHYKKNLQLSLLALL